jgi:PAS domain S-box-containing protein
LQGVVGDISARKAQEARLRESEARFRAMADSAPAPVWVTSAAGPIEFVNKAFLEFSGKPATELLGDGWIGLLHPDDIAGVAERRAKARERSEPYEFEARFKAAGGEWCWMHASSRPRFDEAGAFQGYVGLAVDVTETRAAQVSQQLLINELNHRVKNTLSTVQSIARQTMREGLITRSAREAFTDRLLALSSAHNVLTQQAWESADLAEIIAEAVRPYDEPSRPRVLAEGPPARVAPRVALAVSMAIHELATNATKHGSLSADSGTVSLSWRRCADRRTLEILWVESGGPPVRSPERRGFGSRLLVQGLAADLGKPAVLTFGEQGLSCVLLVPVLPS